MTKIIEDGIAVDVTIEGGYLARSYLLGSMNSTYLDLLAYQSKKKLEMLPIRGKFWRQESVISTLSPTMSISDADYMVSKTTKEQENGAVLLFTALQLLEEDGEKDFGMDVNDKVSVSFMKLRCFLTIKVPHPASLNLLNKRSRNGMNDLAGRLLKRYSS